MGSDERDSGVFKGVGREQRLAKGDTSPLSTAAVIEQMSRIDPLAPCPNVRAFAAKRVRLRPFSLTDFRRAQAKGVPRLYQTTPTPPRASYRRPRSMVRRLFGKEDAQRFAVIQDFEQKVTRSHWKGANIARRWNEGSRVFAVTDHSDAVSVKSAFCWDLVTKQNFLSRDGLRRFEVCGPVLATSGHLTASHVDDPDIWNSCLSGRKLWYLMDATDWAKHEGVNNETLLDSIHFDFETFMKIPSSRWAIVEEGNAFYCPNRYAHRVVTLDRYIGAGTFMVTPESRTRLLRYWARHGTQWARSGEGEEFVDHVRRAVL